MTVSTTDVLMYSKDDYELLKQEITNRDTEQSIAHHNGYPVTKSGLLIFIEHILYKHDYSGETVDCWLNLSCRKLLYKAPIKNMPLLINSKKLSTRILATWRLKINK